MQVLEPGFLSSQQWDGCWQAIEFFERQNKVNKVYLYFVVTKNDDGEFQEVVERGDIIASSELQARMKIAHDLGREDIDLDGLEVLIRPF